MATSSGDSTHSQNTQQNSEFDVFDRVYYKKGRVLIIPDVRKPKVDFFKKAIPSQQAASPEEDKGQQGLRSQETQGKTTKGHGGRNPQVATKRNKKGQQEDEYMPYVLDEDKRKNADRVREQEADDSEVLAIELIKTALEETMKPDDPPVVILHSQFLTSKTNNSTSAEQFKIDKSKGEMDIFIFHPMLGILIVEVKSTKTIDSHAQQDKNIKKDDPFSPVEKATYQLIRNQTSIQEEMGDLLEKDATILTIALPNLKPEASSVIREEAEERKRKKQASDAKEGTSSTKKKAVETSDAGTKKQTASASTAPVPKRKKEPLGDHPEILLLCGSTPEVLKEWVTHVMQRRASAGHAFKGATDDERLSNHREACERRLSIASLHPGQAVKDSAALHRRFILTEEQLLVRDSQAHLLHVWGPPGSGKTLLLAERARRWIREGRRVALAVGISWYTPLLYHLTSSVCRDKTDVARVSTHTDDDDLLRWLDTDDSTVDPVYVFVDEALRVDYSRLLPHVTSGRVAGVWSADTADLNDKYKAAWQAVGGITVQLQLCLRCPPSVMALSNAVGGTSYPPLLPPPVPVTQELGMKVVISHADHGQSQSCKKCSTCREGVKNFFSSLGLLGDNVTSSLSLSQCVVITTGHRTDKKKDVAEFLGGLGLRAVAERIPLSTPVLLPGQTPQSRDEARDDARSRLVAGIDVAGRPVIHVVHCNQFLGLERVVVVVWHRDRGDEDEDKESQGQEDRDGRKDWHRRDWYQAATRCQGRLLLVVTSPSPLLSLVSASSPMRGQAKSSLSSPLSSPSSSSDVKAAEKRHSAGTDPTQSPTSP